MKSTALAALLTVMLVSPAAAAQPAPLSPETEECLGCHTELHPGLVASWQQSRHSMTTPSAGQAKPVLERRISADTLAESLQGVVVGCYECHGLRTDQHGDAFEHNGFQINVVVSSADCATCHPTEADEYQHNLMAHAYGNLVDNSLYQQFTAAVNNRYTYSHGRLTIGAMDMLTEYESCLYCHGTRVESKGLKVRDTAYGEMEFPDLEGWPNQGVGRINPDGSKGACTSCHPRHDFSIATARKPHTCSECHKGPDVPAYKVYEVSKHGNIYSSQKEDFTFTDVPWTVGEDFTAPTCAACHGSLLVDPSGGVIAQRSHRYNDRLAWRLFGVPYAHPHPRDADLKDVVNSMGLPLAVELDGRPVERFVIDQAEQDLRNSRMKAVCHSCHSGQWVANHFLRLDNTLKITNDITVQATAILGEIWAENHESGLPQKSSIFDEEGERMWTKIWLFYANSTRFASAMAGGGDYGVFADGRFQTTEQLTGLVERLQLYRQLEGKKTGE